MEQIIPARGKILQKSAKFILFFSHFQLLTMASSKLWLIDATFSSAPPGFYQILIIIAIDEKVNLPIPVAYALMQSKDSVQYQGVLNTLLTVSKEKGFVLNPNTIICDFEYALHKSLRSYFPNTALRGCYFHLVKSWWRKAQILGLKTKSKLPKTKDIIFKLKLLVHLPQETRQKYFQIIKDLYKNEFGYQNFFAYLQKWYIDDTQVSFSKMLEYTDKFNIGNQFIRTNNIMEGNF